MKPEYAILIKNKTRLEALVERFNTKEQAKFYIEKMGGDFQEYVDEHEQFYRSFVAVQTMLSKVIKNKIVEREHVPSYIFAQNNLIVVVGQDGLVANVAKYAKGVPIVAVNPDMNRYDGILLPYHPDDFIKGVQAVMTQDYHTKRMRFAEATLNDGQRLLAVNDLFIGLSSHSSARYKIIVDGCEEMHSSSGIIVSTKTGSTGWLSSIFNMAYGILGEFETSYPELEDDELFFAVREPFKSIRTQTNICGGRLDKNSKLIIESMMPINGYIFSDGIEQDFLQFNSGAIAEIGISKDEAVLVIS